jgi:SAM-dependent methyltransferase
VIVTSRSTAKMLDAYDVPADRIVVVEPGTNAVVSPQPPVTSRQPLQILCVATVIPRKGHAILLRALATLRDLPWRLTCVGGLDRDPALVTRLRALVHEDGLDDRVAFAGEMSGPTLDAEYARADLFVLPTLYEGYGMVVAEALAHGLPVISTPTGGIDELIRGVRGQADAEAGLLVAAGDAAALESALRRVLTDAGLRAEFARGAQLARDRIPTWDQQVERLAAALSSDSADARQVLRTRRDTSFSADWLALREPADTAARSVSLTEALAGTLPETRPLRILDLGAGTGANARYLIDRLPSPQQWLLVDHDAGLLTRAVALLSSRLRCEIDTLAADLAAVQNESRDDSYDLVTASALLDLVSEPWLRALVDRCHARGAAVLFALTYDGRIECAPADSADGRVRELVNRHQRTDKGFGPALGPDAADAAARLFAAAGYTVTRARSDWTLGSESEELQRQLIEGWAGAAGEMDLARANDINAWKARRLAHVDGRRSRIVVGHEDLVGWKKKT